MKITITISDNAVDRLTRMVNNIAKAADHIGNAARNLTPGPPTRRSGLRSLRLAADAAFMRILGRTRL